MSQGIKNIMAVVVIAAVAALGYFLFIQTDSTPLSIDGYAEISSQLLIKTQVFIDRRQQLENTQLDLAVLTDSRFVSLRSFETEVPEQTVGKNNIFNEAQFISGLE